MNRIVRIPGGGHFRRTSRQAYGVPYALLTVLAAAICFGIAPAQQKRSLLAGPYDPGSLSQWVVSAAEWHPFPRAVERKEWLALPAGLRFATIHKAEGLRGVEWIVPRATVFLDYVRTGNRERYQSVSYGRRERLATLVLAECMEGKGRFVDDIADGVWAICEESWWGVPAHLSLQRRGDGLPDVTEPTVDLFAAETGTLLGWTAYLLPEALDHVSPMIRERIRLEVRRRIIDVNLERDDFWWMGFSRTVNNWNPWICSNWLTTVLLLEDDPARRVRSVRKILVCLDNFLDPYPADGGCDEGPTYWTRAGGSLFDCLELLHSASGGRIDVYSNPLIREIGRYVCRTQIHGDLYLNFADAPARSRIDPSLVFRYGRAIGDSTMMRFGAYLAAEQQVAEKAAEGRFGVLGRVLPALFSLDAIRGVAPREPLLRDFWLPDIQVMGARSSGGSVRGFFLGAQGGHNAESHNHNDVGNFVLAVDGEPVIIDVGVETYTARTFGKDRYTIWTMQSAYHNVPLINGVMQREGREFEAKEVRYRSDESGASISMNIAAAYPAEAKCARWDRTMTLIRKDTLRVTDRYTVEEVKGEIALTFMTVCPPTLRGDGTILLNNAKGRGVVLSYDRSVCSARMETIVLNDAQLRASWGERLYRILLSVRHPAEKGEFTTVIRRE
jgi:hypothetical protein